MNRAAWIPLLFCLLPLTATGWRGWRWLTGAAFGGFLALAGYAWWIVETSGPDVHGFALAILLIFVLTSALALAAGAAGRAAGLSLQRRGRSRSGVIWTDLAALAVPVTLILYLGL